MPIRPLIPGAECSATFGGLPALSCPPLPPLRFSGLLAGEWNPEGSDPMPIFRIGIAAADISGGYVPEEWSMAWAFSVVIGEPPLIPTEDDIPQGGAWQTMSEGQVNPTLIGVDGLEPSMWAEIFGNAAIWLRFRLTNLVTGCEFDLLFYFPAAIPLTATEDVAVTVFDGGHLFSLTVPAAPADDEAGEPVQQGIVMVPTCPAPQRALAVLPACGAMPVEVVGDPVTLGARIFRYAPEDDSSPFLTEPGARSVTIEVIEAADDATPTLEILDDTGAGAHALPVGYRVTFTADHPGESLPQMEITPNAAGGDVVMISQTYVVA